MMSHITFRELPPSASGLTKNWMIYSHDGDDTLGRVGWYSPWRRYTFEGRPGCIFDVECLRDIAWFLESEMNKRKKTREC